MLVFHACFILVDCLTGPALFPPLPHLLCCALLPHHALPLYPIVFPPSLSLRNCLASFMGPF